MRAFSILLSVLTALATVVSAGPNPFSYPTAGEMINGGDTMALKWNPTTQGTVSIKLRHGNAIDLADGFLIASHIQNSGHYDYMVPTSLPYSAYYTFEIISDQDPDLVNYSPTFAITPTTDPMTTVTGLLPSTIETKTKTSHSANATPKPAQTTEKPTKPTGFNPQFTGTTDNAAPSAVPMGRRENGAMAALAVVAGMAVAF